MKSNENTCPVGEVAEEWQRLGWEWGFCEYTFFFSHTAWHAGSQFPDQGWNPCSLQWKCRGLTTGPPRKSWSVCFNGLNQPLSECRVIFENVTYSSDIPIFIVFWNGIKNHSFICLLNHYLASLFSCQEWRKALGLVRRRTDSGLCLLSWYSSEGRGQA